MHLQVHAVQIIALVIGIYMNKYSSLLSRSCRLSFMMSNAYNRLLQLLTLLKAQNPCLSSMLLTVM